MAVVEVDELSDLSSYRDDWERLLRETAAASFFQSLDWLECYWKHFGADQRLRTLLVYQQDRLVGILPLVVKPLATRGGAIRMLTYPLDEWGTRFGPIGPSPAETLAAGLKHIGQSQRDWDVVELNWVAEPDGVAANLALAHLGGRPQRFARPDLLWIDLNRSWDDYWQGLSSKHRNNVRRAEKKLVGHGQVEFHEYHAVPGDEPDSYRSMYETCEVIAAASWQGESNTGTTLSHPRVQPFLRDAFNAAVRVGAASLYLLTVDDQPAAYSCNYRWSGSEFGLRMGYVASMKQLSPGTVLLHRMLQAAFESGQHTFDLGEGDSKYKHLWLTHVIPSHRFCHYAKTSLRAQALRLKRRWSGDVNCVV